jgi:hypothetical protein
MRIITPLGIGVVKDDEFENSQHGSVLSVQIGQVGRHLGHMVDVPRHSIAPYSPNGVIRVITRPNETIGTLQFHRQVSTVNSIIGCVRPADESVVNFSQTERTVKMSSGIKLEGVAILMPWVDRWAMLNTVDRLSITEAVSAVKDAEARVSGTSVGISALVAFDTKREQLLYVSLWCESGIIRFCYHDLFPE